MIEFGVAPELVIKNSMGVLFADDFLRDPQNVDAYITAKLNNPYSQSPQGLAGNWQLVKTMILVAYWRISGCRHW